jgi:hypothetical protein
MILSYRDARTARFAAGHRVKQFEPFRRKAEKVLAGSQRPRASATWPTFLATKWKS